MLESGWPDYVDATFESQGTIIFEILLLASSTDSFCKKISWLNLVY